MTSDIDVLTEYVRQALARQITTQYARGQISIKSINCFWKSRENNC